MELIILLSDGVIDMQINVSLSPLANVLGLINAKNGSSITENQVTVDACIASAENPGDNTKITLTGIDGEGIEGTRSFYYGRYDLLGAKTSDPSRVEILDTDDQTQIRTKIFTAYGLKASEVVVNSGSDVTTPAADDVTFTTMAPITDSLLYNGSPVKVNVVRSGAVIPMTLAIPDPEFSGLTDLTLDTAKTPTQNFYDAINKIYPWGFSSTVLSTANFGVYSAEGSPANTTITLNALGGSGFSGSVTVHYRRLDIMAQVTPLPTSVTILEADTDSQIKAKVSSAYHLINTAIQITSIVRPTAQASGSCNIKAAGNATTYTGTTYPIVLSL